MLTIIRLVYHHTSQSAYLHSQCVEGHLSPSGEQVSLHFLSICPVQAPVPLHVMEDFGPSEHVPEGQYPTAQLSLHYLSISGFPL